MRSNLNNMLLGASVGALAGTTCSLATLAIQTADASPLENHISLPASVCRWDPTDDAAVDTHSVGNQYWITAGTKAVNLYCPIPSYFGYQHTGPRWGMSAATLGTGELSVTVQSNATAKARLVQNSPTGTSFSLCSFASGSGVPATLQPVTCSAAHTVIVLQVTIPSNGSFLGAMIHDYD